MQLTLLTKHVDDLFVLVCMGTYDPPKEDQPFQKLFLFKSTRRRRVYVC